MAHSDIKPANVLLAEGPDGIGGRLSDLGLARFLAPGTTLTSMGRASSVEYVDPDVIGGARPSRRTEIWALGATVHRALTGTGLYGELPDAQPLLAIRKVLGAAAAGRPGVASPTRPSSCGCAWRPTAAAADRRGRGRPAGRAALLRRPAAGQAVPARLRIVTVPSLRFVT